MSWTGNVVESVNVIGRLDNLKDVVEAQSERIRLLELESQRKNLVIQALEKEITTLREQRDKQTEELLKLSLEVKIHGNELNKLQDDFEKELEESATLYHTLETTLDRLNGKVEDTQKRQDLEKEIMIQKIEILFLRAQTSQTAKAQLPPAKENSEEDSDQKK